jgi:uncharacterized protein with PIN domain
MDEKLERVIAEAARKALKEVLGQDNIVCPSCGADLTEENAIIVHYHEYHTYTGEAILVPDKSKPEVAFDVASDKYESGELDVDALSCAACYADLNRDDFGEIFA